MKDRNRRQSWKKWWLLDTDVLRRQAENDPAPHLFSSARGLAFCLSLLLGGAVAGRGGLDFTSDHVWLMRIGIAEGMMFLGLGCLLNGGYRTAALGLMALYTADRIAGNILAYQSDESYRNHIGFWLCIGPLTWAICMRVFYVAFRGNQPRAGMGRPETPVSGGITSTSH